MPVAPGPPPAYGGGGNDGVSKLFIGGLTPTTTKEMLEAHFSQFGQLIDAVVMTEAETGKPRGFGFVQYDNPQSADVAFRFAAGHVLDGKAVEVKKAQPRGSPALAATARGGYGGAGGYGAAGYGGYGGGYGAPAPRGGGFRGPNPYGRGGYGGGAAAHYPPAPRQTMGPAHEDAQTAQSKIFIGGLNKASTEDSLANYFSRFGIVQSCEVMRRDGISRGFGFVVFTSPDQAQLVLSSPNHSIDGKLVEVKACQPRSAEPPQRGPPMQAPAPAAMYGAESYYPPAPQPAYSQQPPMYYGGGPARGPAPFRGGRYQPY